MSTFTVESVEQAETFKTDNGEFQVWKVAVTDGDQLRDAQLNTKAGKPGPEVGEVIDGTLTKGQYGWKLKRNFQPGGGGKGGWQPKTPEEVRSMHRAVAQKAAVALLAVEVQAGRKLLEVEDLFSQEKAVLLLTPRIDFFYDDLQKAMAG